MYQKFVLETGDVLFKRKKKGRYIRHYMSVSQYKPGENTEIYAHTVAL